MKKQFIILLSVLSLTAMAQNDVKRVAILETVDKLGTVPYMKQLMFRSNLTTAISNTEGYEGYDRADLKQILGEQNFQRTGLVSDKDIKKIGEFTGAQYVLIAEAVIDGDDMFITAKIIDVETARVIRNSNQLMGTSSADMQKGSQKVAADLLVVAAKRSSKNIPAGYVDLGLPSGTLWKDRNEYGYYNYDQAVSIFGRELPTAEQYMELRDSCQWIREGNGYKVVGPNKEYIFFPSLSMIPCGEEKIYDEGKQYGHYWSSSPSNKDVTYALGLFLSSSSGADLWNDERCKSMSVRLVK